MSKNNGNSETFKVLGGCDHCGLVKQVEVSRDGYKKFTDGVIIQVALPTLSPDDRELLLTNTCGKCWDKFVGKNTTEWTPAPEDELDMLELDLKASRNMNATLTTGHPENAPTKIIIDLDTLTKENLDKLVALLHDNLGYAEDELSRLAFEIAGNYEFRK